MTVVETTDVAARTAAELQNELQEHGETLPARDLFIAGTALQRDEPLAVSDDDFDVKTLSSVLDISLV